MSFTNELRKAIRQSGFSQNEIAKRANVPQSSISRFMREIRSLDSRTIERICSSLKLELSKSKKTAKKKE